MQSLYNKKFTECFDDLGRLKTVEFVEFFRHWDLIKIISSFLCKEWMRRLQHGRENI